MLSEAHVDGVTRKNSLDIVNYAGFLVGQKVAYIQFEELIVGYSENHGIEFAIERFQTVALNINSVFTLYTLGIGPGIKDCDIVGVFQKSVIDVNNLGVADIGAIFLESDAQNKNIGILYLHAFKVHGLDGLVGHIATHAVVKAAGREHHAWQNAIDLCFLNQIIGVDRNAVTADQTGVSFMKFHFEAAASMTS